MLSCTDFAEEEAALTVMQEAIALLHRELKLRKKSRVKAGQLIHAATVHHVRHLLLSFRSIKPCKGLASIIHDLSPGAGSLTY